MDWVEMEEVGVSHVGRLRRWKQHLVEAQHSVEAHVGIHQTGYEALVEEE